MSPLEGDLQVINSDVKILITAKERFKNMSSGIYLVVETPRAGKLGHRYIKSSNVLPTEQSIVDVFTKAGMNPVGANYISISIPVIQTLPGSVRQGNEKIVLIGVNTQKVDIVKIKTALQKLFVPLDHVIKGTDWEKESNKIICFNPILQDWISGEDFQDLPEYKPEDPKPPPSVLSKKLLLIIIVILFVSGGVWLSQIFPSLRKKPDPSVDNKSTEQYMNLLMGEFKCKEEVDKFKKEMKSYIEATSPKYEESKLEEYAKSFFDEKNKLITEKYASILKGGNNNFKSYYESIQGKDQKEIRKNIYACYEKFMKLRKDVLNNDKLKDNILDYKTINFGLYPDLNYEEPKTSPITPLYNNTDKHIFEIFNDWFSINKTSLELTNVPPDFSEYINNLKKNNKAIFKKLDELITHFNNDASLKKGPPNVVFLNYLNDAKEFITELCKLAPP